MNLQTITQIVKASGVQPGELVLIHFWGEDADKQIANDFLIAAASLGASPVLLQQSRKVNCDLFAAADDACFSEQYFDLFSRFDAVLDVFAQQPIVPGCAYEAEPLRLYRRTISQLFSALMKARRFTQIRIPTRANAAESGLEPEEYIRRMEAAYDIDYSALAQACREAKARYEQHRRLILKTGSDCELHFDLTGREWYIDAGDGDWPCGEIYIAPLENATHGTVFFEKLFVEEIGVFDSVTLHVENGRVISSDHEAVAAFLHDQPVENTVVCELGLGLNPSVTDLCGYTVLDEKRSGAFHIALGANGMFDGQNDANMHLDLVGGHYQLIAEV